MESARIPLLLRPFVVQYLRVCGRRHARATPARDRGNPKREEIRARLSYGAAGIELVLPVARESNPLNWALDAERWALLKWPPFVTL